MRRLAVLSMLAIFFGGSAASAATVSVVTGQVLINRGDGYRQVVGATEANPGDTVVVNPGGQAQLVYPDGCSITIGAGAVMAIAPESPCGSQAASGINLTTVAVGAAIVGGGALAAFLLLDDKDKPASP